MQNQPATNLRKGMDVLGSDGDKLGEVERVRSSHFVVKEGVVFPKEQFIPSLAVAYVDDDGVHLSVTKEAALYQGWETEPSADPASVTSDDPTRPRTAQFELGTSGEYRRGTAGNVDSNRGDASSPAAADPSPLGNEERFTRGAGAAPYAGEPVVDKDAGGQPPDTRPFDDDAHDPVSTVANADLNASLDDTPEGDRPRGGAGSRNSRD